MRVLITGFEKYWDYPENSSWIVAKEVAVIDVEDVNITIEQMPVCFSRIASTFRLAVEKYSPDLIIMLGQSGGSDRVKLERVALNLMDARIPDNEGYIPNEKPIQSNTPSALFTNLPIKDLRMAIEEQGIAVKISNSCGLYVCNRLYYEALMMCREKLTMQAVFVHLPFYEGQPSAKQGKPTMPINEMVKAIQIIINEVYEKNRNIKETTCVCL